MEYRTLKTALFPGSFDPFTIGHQAVVDEGLRIFDRIIIGIGDNAEKNSLLKVANRKRLIEDLYKGNDRVDVEVYDMLTGEYCHKNGITFILRGMRNTIDYEYERNIMLINKRLFPEITTVLLFTPPQFVAVSSSVIRELIHFGNDPTGLMPQNIDIKKYL